MKGIFSFLTILTLLVCFSSCQKEVDGALSNQPANDSTILWKYIVVDTTLTPGLDTLEVYYFEYDNQKRLSRLVDSSREDTSSSPAYTYSSVTNFSYNGNEVNPLKSIRIIHDVSDSQWDTSYFAYQGQLVSMDSSRVQINNVFGNSWGVVVRYFTKNGNSVTMVERFPGPPICETTSIITQTYSNGNISTQNASSTGCGTGSWDDQLTYDNKANPFYTAIPVHYPVTDFSFFGNDQKNNIVEKKSISGGTHAKYFYTYRNNGLPSIVRVNDLLFPQYSIKGMYYYKN